MYFKPETIAKLRTSELAVCFVGAGLAVESGVPAYRDTAPIWGPFHANELASVKTFKTNPELGWIWCRDRRAKLLAAEPNDGHHALAALQRLMERLVVVTHSPDSFMNRAGVGEVIELYGNLFRSKCTLCGIFQDDAATFIQQDVPTCSCSKRAPLRPDVVLEGEEIDSSSILAINKIIEQADVFILIGSTGDIYPAGTLLMQSKFFKSYIIEINPIHTKMTRFADDAVQLAPSFGIIQLLEQLQRSIADELQ